MNDIFPKLSVIIKKKMSLLVFWKLGHFFLVLLPFLNIVTQIYPAALLKDAADRPQFAMPFKYFDKSLKISFFGFS